MAHRILVPIIFVFFLFTTSCSSDTEKGCNEDPWSCPSGQTCWLSSGDDASWDGTFQCLNSKEGMSIGDSCSLIEDGALGAPSCSDGQFCLQLVASDAPDAFCTQYCDLTDPDHACPAGYTCGRIQFGEGISIKACHPDTTTNVGGEGEGEGEGEGR